MSQEQWVILAFKIVLVTDAVAVTAFVVQYWRLAPWWRNAIGRTIVIKDILLVVCLLPSILSLFFHFSRLTSQVAAWIDVAAFALITPVMIWRIAVWQRIHNRKADAGDEGT